jgi:predicted Zn-dependent peptidase
MFLEIREKRGLAYYVGTFSEQQSDAGNFGTRAGIAREKLPEAITVIIDEYKKICDEKVTDDELKRAKDYLVGSSQMHLESSGAIASFLSWQWVMKNKVESFSKEVKKIKAVTAEDVQAVAREIFVNKWLNLAIVGPHQGMEEEFLKILKF